APRNRERRVERDRPRCDDADAGLARNAQARMVRPCKAGGPALLRRGLLRRGRILRGAVHGVLSASRTESVTRFDSYGPSTAYTTYSAERSGRPSTTVRFGLKKPVSTSPAKSSGESPSGSGGASIAFSTAAIVPLK